MMKRITAKNISIKQLTSEKFYCSTVPIEMLRTFEQQIIFHAPIKKFFFKKKTNHSFPLPNGSFQKTHVTKICLEGNTSIQNLSTSSSN